MALRTIKRQSVYEQVVARLKSHIVDNGLQPGDRLPSEAELAERLGVSRLSVREALKVMESFGIVQAKTRDGTRLRSLTVEPITDHLGFLLDVKGITMKEIVIARRAVECALMPLIVENAEEGDFLRMETAIERMREAAERHTSTAEADLEFHQALLLAAKNRALQGLGLMLQEFFSRRPSEVHRNVQEKRLAVQRSLQEHEEIYQALRTKDAATAQKVMERHLTEYLEHLP